MCAQDVYGIMKKRFPIFKNPIRFFQVKDIDNMWPTCCALHNWLLELDGFKGFDVGNDEEDFEARTFDNSGAPSVNANTSTHTEAHAFRRNETRVEQPSEFHTMRKKLVVHYAQQKKKGKLEWLRGRNK